MCEGKTFLYHKNSIKDLNKSWKADYFKGAYYLRISAVFKGIKFSISVSHLLWIWIKLIYDSKQKDNLFISSQAKHWKLSILRGVDYNLRSLKLPNGVAIVKINAIFLFSLETCMYEQMD